LKYNSDFTVTNIYACPCKHKVIGPTTENRQRKIDVGPTVGQLGFFSIVNALIWPLPNQQQFSAIEFSELGQQR
jgi:hypothetical protein